MKKSSRLNQLLELIILLSLLGILLVSCRTVKKEIVPDPIPFHDTLRTTVREHVVLVHDTLLIPLPQESREVTTRDTTSTLRTTLAISTATILSDGTLLHTLENLKQALTHLTSTKVIYRDSLVESIKEVPLPYPVEVQVEKPLTKWQNLKLNLGGLLLLLFLIWSIFTALKFWRRLK